jgi:four helix bundle protein
MVDGGMGNAGGGGEMRVEEMPVYQLFYDLALRVERDTRDYGPDFRWLRNQSLRASESVCGNMTEGFYAQYSTEYLQSLFRCRREGRETTTHVSYGKDVGQLSQETAASLLAGYEEALQQLASLIASIERKIEARGKSKPSVGYVREDQDAYGSPSEVPTDHSPIPPLTINH